MFESAGLSRVLIGVLTSTSLAVPVGMLLGLGPQSGFLAQRLATIRLHRFPPLSRTLLLGFCGAACLALGNFFWGPLHFSTKAAIVAGCSLWPVLVSSGRITDSIQQNHQYLARMLQLGFWERWRSIVIPSALPALCLGLRQSLGVAWFVWILAELSTSVRGLLPTLSSAFDSAAHPSLGQLLLTVAALAAIVWLVDQTVRMVQRHGVA